MAFAKSLLTECDRDTDLSIDGFGAPFRLDRLAGVAWKTQGGGVCLYVSKPYSVTVRERICKPNVDGSHFALSGSPASRTISDVVQRLQSISPDSPNFILGDFNCVSLKQTLKTFQQYVSCPSRRDKTLDLCNGSVKDTYKSLPLSPWGSADHSCIHLLPTCKTNASNFRKKSNVNTALLCFSYWWLCSVVWGVL